MNPIEYLEANLDVKKAMSSAQVWINTALAEEPTVFLEVDDGGLVMIVLTHKRKLNSPQVDEILHRLGGKLRVVMRRARKSDFE